MKTASPAPRHPPPTDFFLPRFALAKGERWFCPSCGTPLTFVGPGDPTQVDVTLASLDDPAAFPPGCHAWTMSRVPWLEIGDKLPRYASTRSEGESAGP